MDHELQATGRRKDSPRPAPGSTGTDADTLDDDREPVLQGEASFDPDEVATLRDLLARLQAEFENARKRAAKEQEAYQEYAAFETVKSLVPVPDSLEAALKAPFMEVHAALHDGVELTQRQFVDVLSKLGVRQINATGEKFYPEIHHAVGVAEIVTAKDGCIVEQLQPGYWFKDRLLRPAMVIVSRKS